MKNNSSTVTKTINLSLLWITVLVVSVTAFFLTYYYNFTTPIKVIIWIIWCVLTGIIVFFTPQGQQLAGFANEANKELKKIVWPTRQETIQTTSIVMIMVAVTGFILWGVDSGMMLTIAKITHLG